MKNLKYLIIFVVALLLVIGAYTYLQYNVEAPVVEEEEVIEEEENGLEEEYESQLI